ncbi:DUF5309 domain-containing protein [Brevibacillus sp. MCWH]|jgi:hypothetical protein|uniref:DUF5309 domain-containing protein n=1 Tax=Brevibacillus sp. MCWH TaxID=2508871 RepID=UPI001493250E|nr:DUF5309 domain-containing protein [Brevibacillus sp. MCWH]NNV01658.1 phage major capsid protein [Brevibacillus sp. MCWH]
MFTTGKLTNSESISLSKEISLAGVQDTPLMSLLLAKGRTEKANGKIHTWRERTLDSTADISQVEGSETTVFQESGRAELNNVCEIFKKAASVSGTVQAISVPGQPNVFAAEVNDRLIELKVNMEKALTTGTRNDGSASPYIRRMDGLDKFVDPANIVSGATAGVITEDELKQTVRKLWEQGLPTGEYFALVNADIKEQIDEMYKGSYRYIAQENVFGLTVDKLRTNYGDVNFILSRHVPEDKLIVFDANYLDIAFLRQPMFEMLAKTGDAIKGHVIAEATLKVASKKAVAMYDMA